MRLTNTSGNKIRCKVILDEDFSNKYDFADHYARHVAPNPLSIDSEKNTMEYVKPEVYEHRANWLKNATAGEAHSDKPIVGFMVSEDRALKYDKRFQNLVIYNVQSGEISTFYRCNRHKFEKRLERDFYKELEENESADE